MHTLQKNNIYKVYYEKESTPVIDMGYSLDGSAFTAWSDGVDNGVTLNAGESVYVWNKKENLNTGEYTGIRFKINKACNISGNVNSLLNFTDVKAYSFYQLFKGAKIVDASKLNLPSTKLNDRCYEEMFIDNTDMTPYPPIDRNGVISSSFPE